MSAQRFRRDQRFILDGVTMRVRGMTIDGNINYVSTGDGHFDSASQETLLKAWSENRLVFIDESEARTARLIEVKETNFEEQSPASKRAALALQPYVQEFHRRGMRHCASRNQLQALIADVFPTAPNRIVEAGRNGEPDRCYPPEWKVLSRVLVRWDRLGRPDPSDPCLFLPDYRNRGNRAPRYSSDQEAAIQESVSKLAMKRQRASAKAIADELDDALKEKGLVPVGFSGSGRRNMVSQRTILRRINERSTYEKTLAWKGASAAAQCRPVGKWDAPAHPLEVVEIDFHNCDVLHRALWGNGSEGRPIVAAAMDVYSRAYAGLVTVAGYPSEAVLLRLLKQIVSPKFDVLSKHPEIKGNWDLDGKPLLIRLDNAMEHHAGSFRDACRVLGIRLEWTEKKKPMQRPFVERGFKTVAENVFHELPATTFSNTVQRKDWYPERSPKLTLEQIEKVLLWWAIDEYHVKNHSGIDMAPIEKYREGLQRYQPPLAGSRTQLDRICSLQMHRPLTREGITIAGLRFNDKERRVHDLLNDPHKPEKCLVLVNPDNLDSVQLRDWRRPTTDVSDDAYVTLPSLDEDLTDGVNLDEHYLYCEAARRRRRDYENITHDQLRETRRRIKEYIEQCIKLQAPVGKRLMPVANKVAARSDVKATPVIDGTCVEVAPAEVALQPVPASSGQTPAKQTIDRDALRSKWNVSF